MSALLKKVLGPRQPQINSSGKPKLLEQVRAFMRARRYSLRTERAYLDWIPPIINFAVTPAVVSVLGEL